MDSLHILRRRCSTRPWICIVRVTDRRRSPNGLMSSWASTSLLRPATMRRGFLRHRSRCRSQTFCEASPDYCNLQQRSEEHTSELQSLMRISYAVFCLKKKNEMQKKQNKIDTQ